MRLVHCVLWCVCIFETFSISSCHMTGFFVFTNQICMLACKCVCVCVCVCVLYACMYICIYIYIYMYVCNFTMSHVIIMSEVKTFSCVWINSKTNSYMYFINEQWDSIVKVWLLFFHGHWLGNLVVFKYYHCQRHKKNCRFCIEKCFFPKCAWQYQSIRSSPIA
jgi:hypothetical protein